MNLLTLGGRGNRVKKFRMKRREDRFVQRVQEAVGVCRAIKTLLLIGGVALAYCSSTDAAISSGAITLNGAASASLIITEGVSIAVNASFTDTAPTNNDGAIVIWGDSSTNNGVVVLANLGSNITVTASHQYATGTVSAVTISVVVTNVVGATSTDTASSSGGVADAPLSVVSTSSGTNAIEGVLTNVTLLTFFDANPLATTNNYTSPPTVSNLGSITIVSNAYSIVSAGSSNGGALFNVQGTLEFSDEGTDKVQITVIDMGGSPHLVATSTVIVADAPLFVVSTNRLVFYEGVFSNETLLTFMDGNGLATNSTISDFTAVVQWGDNNSNISTDGTGYVSIGYVGSNQQFYVQGEHPYVQEGTNFITVTVTDKGGSTITVSGDTNIVADAGLVVATINPALPTLQGYVSLAQQSENSLGQWLISFTDSNEYASVPPISIAPFNEYTAIINWGDGSPNTAGTILKNNGTASVGEFVVYGNHTYDATCKTFPNVFVMVTDVGGANCMTNTSVTVLDAPIIGNGYSIVAAANSTFSGTVASFTDPDSALNASTFTATINWDDGTPYTSGTIVSYGTDVYLVQGSHSYVAAPLTPKTVTVTVTDTNVCATPQSLPATTITFSGTGISFLYGALPTFIEVGTDSSFTTNLATFTDSTLPPGSAFDLEAVINWGDGTTSDGSITTNAANQYVVSGTHTYLDDGSYPVSVEVVDINGNQRTLSNITIVSEASYTDLTSDVEVLFGPVTIKQYRSAGESKGEDYYYSEVVTLKNTSGTTLTGPFGLVLNTDIYPANNMKLLNITGQLADGREYVPLSIDTLKPKGTLRVTLEWSDQATYGRGPVILPVRLIAGPGL